MSDNYVTAITAVILVIVFAIGFSLLMSFPVAWCWNYVMPYLVGAPIIDWKKAWCLMFLFNLLKYSYNNKK